MKTESVSLQMEQLLDDYSEEVQKVTDEAIRKTVKDAVEMLREKSPQASGRYAKGWTAKSTGTWSRVVYNKADYQLTHLLENGHVVKNQYGTWGRVDGIKHIKPVEEWAGDELQIRISRGLS